MTRARSVGLMLVLAAAGCAGPATPPAGGAPPQAFDHGGPGIDYTNLRASFEVGPRRYDSSWGALDDHPAVGVTGSQEPPGWILGWDAGGFWSTDSGRDGLRDLEVDTYELYGGVMKTLHLVPHRLRGELGVGATWGYVTVYDEAALVDAHDDAHLLGGYGRAALMLRLGGTSWVGVAVRAVRAGSASLFGSSFDGDYEQLTFTLSNSW